MKYVIAVPTPSSANESIRRILSNSPLMPKNTVPNVFMKTVLTMKLSNIVKKCNKIAEDEFFIDFSALKWILLLPTCYTKSNMQ